MIASDITLGLWVGIAMIAIGLVMHFGQRLP